MTKKTDWKKLQEMPPKKSPSKPDNGPAAKAGRSSARKSPGSPPGEGKMIDQIFDMVSDAKGGNVNELADEIDAMRAFLGKWGEEFKSEDDSRMACICLLMRDTLTIVMASITVDAVKPKGKKSR